MNDIKRIPTYVKGLDELMEGGVPDKHIVLVCGHAGTMKSSLTYSIIYNAYKDKGIKSVYLTLEQGKESLYTHMEKLGMPSKGVDGVAIIDLAKIRKDVALDKNKAEKVDWLKSIISVLKHYKQRFGFDVLVMDSLAALYALTSFKNPRAELFYFFERLRELDITIFLISEIPADRNVYGLYGIEDFLSDGIIHLKVEQTDAGANLYLGVVKMRTTNHTRTFMPLIFEDGRFEVVQG